MPPKTIDPDGDYYVAELESAIESILGHRFPPLDVGEDEDKDDGSPVFICPGCRQQVKEAHLVARYIGQRQTVLFDPDEEDWDEKQLWGNPDLMSLPVDFGLFQKPLYYTHYTCGSRVSLPDGWRLSKQ